MNGGKSRKKEGSRTPDLEDEGKKSELKFGNKSLGLVCARERKKKGGKRLAGAIN